MFFASSTSNYSIANFAYVKNLLPKLYHLPLTNSCSSTLLFVGADDLPKSVCLLPWGLGTCTAHQNIVTVLLDTQ